MLYDIFLSYQWNIKEQVLKLEEITEQNDFTIWRDDMKTEGGDSLPAEIQNGILNSKIFIPCITKGYSLSEMCIKELSYAIDTKKLIIPLIFDDSKISELNTIGFLLTGVKYISISEENWIEKLNKAIKKKLLEYANKMVK
jgi:hypothetical protein